MPGRSSGNTANRPVGSAPQCRGCAASEEGQGRVLMKVELWSLGPSAPFLQMPPLSGDPSASLLGLWSLRNEEVVGVQGLGRCPWLSLGLVAWPHQLLVAWTTAGNGKNPLEEGRSKVSPAICGWPRRGMLGMAYVLSSPLHAEPKETRPQGNVTMDFGRNTSPWRHVWKTLVA